MCARTQKVFNIDSYHMMWVRTNKNEEESRKREREREREAPDCHTIISKVMDYLRVGP